jgi:hypothetical protein
MSPYEAIMLVCFGLSWPFALHKTYTTKRCEGKSLPFLFLVLVGYVSGCLHKILYSCDKVILLYILNGLMVAADITLTCKYRYWSTSSPKSPEA